MSITGTAIAFQDLKERRVHLAMILMFVLLAAVHRYFQTSFYQLFLIESSVNLCLLALLIVLIAAYFRLIRKIDPKTTIGKGDLLIFPAFCLGYDIQGFVIHFTIGLCASLILHLVLKRLYRSHQTVPLAGYLAIYFCIQKASELWLS
jgi:hypothetical protein